jgi:hypothetical protein
MPLDAPVTMAVRPARFSMSRDKAPLTLGVNRARRPRCPSTSPTSARRSTR